MNLLINYCPSCNHKVKLNIRINLIKIGYINCPNCQEALTASIFSSVLGTCILGVPAWFASDLLLSQFNLPSILVYIIGFGVCMGVGRLTYPLANLVQVNLD